MSDTYLCSPKHERCGHKVEITLGLMKEEEKHIVGNCFGRHGSDSEKTTANYH